MKTMNKDIFVTRPSLPPLGEYYSYLEDIWETRNLTNLGKYTKLFSEELKKILDVENCLPMSNGHMALELTLQALGLEGEAITTPFTFASTTHAIVRNGLTPVFCDVKESDCTIDPDKIEPLITKKTSAIVPVHVYGIPCEVEKIEDIAKKYNLKVIYDAAHAFGVKINGKGIARFGDASMFSFHATKVFNTIEGGCSVINNYNDIIKLYQLHNFGIMGEEEVEFVGANAKMNEFQAAMGLCNLKHFKDDVEKRKRVTEKYRECLKETKGISFLDQTAEGISYNYSYMPVFIDKKEFGSSRDRLYNLLKENHIYTRKYFYPLTCDYICYKNADFKTDVPVARKKAEEVLTLPIYPDLDISSVEMICEVIKSCKNS